MDVRPTPLTGREPATSDGDTRPDGLPEGGDGGGDRPAGWATWGGLRRGGPFSVAVMVFATIGVLLVWPLLLGAVGVDTTVAVRVRVIQVATVALSVTAAVELFRAALSREGRARLAWMLFGLVPLVWSCGTVVSVLRRLADVPGLDAATRESFRAAAILLAAVAAAVLPPVTRGSLVRRIDTALVLIAAVTALWIVPVVTSSATSEIPLSAVVVIDIVGILTAVGMAIRCGPDTHVELRPLIAASVLFPLSDYVMLFGEPGGMTDVVHRVAGLLPVCAALLLMIAGLRASSGWAEPAVLRRRAMRLHSYLPTGAATVTLTVVAVHQRFTGSIQAVPMALAVATALLAGTRLGLLQARQSQLAESLRATAEELSQEAHHDPLTGLGNRLGLEERLAAALDTDPVDGVTVFFIDLDNFKSINDGLGHDAGDRLLVQLALRLTDVLGGDVYRIGGDEFVAVREDLDRERAEAVATALVAALGPPLTIDGKLLNAAASIGLARSEHRSDGDRRPDEAEALLRRADLALYRAKELGRGRWSSYAPWLQERADRRLALQQGLHRALQRGDFEVHYQPVIDLDTRRVVGAEALVRWRSDEHGLLLPDEFVPVAEEAGLLPDIGRFVIDEAVRRAGPAVLKDGSPLRIAVNLSAQELLHPGTVQQVRSALAVNRVEPGRLQVEITERVVVDPRTGPVVDDLVATGAVLTVQDFGTGPSSLRRLSHYPAATIKVDQSFVAGLGRRRDDRLILQTVAELAADLGLDLVADGVASEAQAVVLRRLGVARAQGWLFGAPVPWEEFAAAHLWDRSGRRAAAVETAS